MQTTIGDYTRFLSAVLQKKRLKEKTWEELFTPQIFIHCDQRTFSPRDTDSSGELKKIGLAYGLGWGLFNSACGKAFFNEGQLDGWLHYSISFPDNKIAYVILTNSTSGLTIFKELVEKIAGVDIPWKWENYIPYRGWKKLSEAELKKFTGVYDGRLKSIITLENGRLKVESPTVSLPKTDIFPQNDHHLFLGIMEADFEFVKGANGEFQKIIADDEGEHYELKKVMNEKTK
jgi:hypothetical protein